jgi:hypothetical protein
MNHFYLSGKILGCGQRTGALNELLAYTLAETLDGPPCSKHARLADMMRTGDVVWNFNYDLLMDNALYGLDKLSDSGYNMRFDYTKTSTGWQETRDASSDIIELKLHGSLNWLRCRECGRNLLLREQKSVNSFSTTVLGGSLRCPKCNDSSLDRMIVPPAGLKNFLSPDMRYLWRRALHCCADIERIIVIGYRFSDVDFELEVLLRTMVQDGTLRGDMPIIIVNPNPQPVEAKFASIFNYDNISHEPNLTTFLETS